MADFLPNLRLRSMFEPAQEGFSLPPVDFSDGEMPSPMGQPEPQGFDVSRRMGELYTPETTATDRFNSLVENMPQYERPSMLRTIAAGLSAFGPGGHESGQQVMNWHNNRNMADWKNQLGPAQQAASLERQNNANERTLAYQQVSNELRARADEERAKNNERNAAIREYRANVYKYKADNPNMRFVFPKGGNVMMINPVTGAKINTGIPTGTLTETDKMNLAQEQAIERIEEQGSQVRETEGVRHGNRMDEIDRRGIWTGTNRGRGSATSEKPETPSQRRTRLYNSAQELVNTNSTLGKWVTIEPGGRFKIEPPGEPGFFGGASGPTKKEYDDIVKFIYGNSLDAAVGDMDRTRGGSQVQPPGSGNADTNKNLPPSERSAAASPAAPPPGELVTVVNPQGKSVRIRKSQLQAALARGYKVQ